MIKPARVNVKPRIQKFEPFQVYYMNELLNQAKLKNNVQPLPAVPTVGIEKIRSKSSLKKYLIEYASASTIHGLKHFIAPNRHIFEKLLVAFSIIGSLAVLIVLSTDFWDRFQNYPTVIVLNHEYRHFNLTKPAIIICPVTQIDESKFSEVFKKYSVQDTEENRNFFRTIAYATYYNFTELPTFSGVEPNLWIYILYDLKPFVDFKLAFPGMWIITERGICLAFNNYAAHYSTIEYWKENNFSVIHPSEILSVSYNERELVEGIKVFAHDIKYTVLYPGNVLQISQKFHETQRMCVSTITLLIDEITSSAEVKQLSLSQRKCKLFEEDGLDMWPIYTFAMCSVECRYKQIYKICKCHPHFARPMPGIPVCDVSQLKCIGQNLKEIILSTTKAMKLCNCYPDCDMAKYALESHTTIELKKGSPSDAIVNIVCRYPSDKFRRQVLFGFSDFLASVGGGAGLFLGASVISFIEIIYFATLRLFWYEVRIYQSKKSKVNISSRLVH